MKSKVFLVVILFVLSITLIGCKDKQEPTVDVEVVGGFDIDVIEDNSVTKVFYVIVKFPTEPKDTDELFKVKVPVKNKLLSVNNMFNYPVGTILNVKEKDLEPYVSKEAQ